MKVILIFAGALLALFGIFNYILALLRSKGRYISPAVYSACGWAVFLVCFATIMFFGALLNKDPGKILSHIHWIWIVIIGLATFVIMLVVGIIVSKRKDLRMGLSLILVGISTLVLMIAGLGMAEGATYEISTAQEFQLLENLPGNGVGYTINITDDIDFEGQTLSDSFGYEYRTYYINGNGHTIKNIRYEKELEADNTCFILGQGTISNLNFENCEFYLKPNNYSEDSHYGNGCEFEIFSSEYSLSNIEVNAVVYKQPAEDSVLYESLSYISSIYPDTYSSHESNIFNVEIKEEVAE